MEGARRRYQLSIGLRPAEVSKALQPVVYDRQIPLTVDFSLVLPRNWPFLARKNRAAFCLAEKTGGCILSFGVDLQKARHEWKIVTAN